MELLFKAADAGSMFWQSLDERERLLLMYAAAIAAALVFSAMQEKRERRLIERVRMELDNGR